MKTIIVTEQAGIWAGLDLPVEVIAAQDYLSQYETYAKGVSRIINLCSTYHYQSIGYYVSLLSEARGHRVFPSVMTTQEFNKPSFKDYLERELDGAIAHSLKNIKSDSFCLSVYFGKNMAEQHERLAKKLQGLASLPLFRVHFEHKKTWRIQKIVSLSMADIPESHLPFLTQAANEFLSKKRFSSVRRKVHHHDLAILHDPNEATPPSARPALKRFIQAANDLGINAELITKDDYKFISEFDALFIRETTAVNNHTYKFALKAFSQGLVVIDDPLSILRCCNKVYLAETLRGNNILCPQTRVISKQNWREIIKTLHYPCVLKQPDSAFSKGVVKAESVEEAAKACQGFLKHSELIIAQEFMPTEFDWRIGVIDQKPLYACKYYMAKGHWQIYDWSSKLKNPWGASVTVELSDVPEAVIQTALKACKLIGDGLYGVDIKEKDGKVYVIEVNDNPDIQSHDEDKMLGDELYRIVMKVFLDRINKKRGYGQ